MILERSIYGVLDLIGDIGGVLEVLVSVVGILMYPLTEYSFVLKALQKLYLARTSNKNLLRKTSLKKKNNKNKYQTKKIDLPGFQDDHPINIGFSQKLSLYLCCANKELKKLYKLGEERL